MNDAKNVDYLSRLPPELLDGIFDAAHTSEQPLTGPLSRRLYPFFLRTRYREIELTSYRQLSTFCNVIRPAVAQNISSFKFSISRLPPDDPPDDMQEEDEEEEDENASDDSDGSDDASNSEGSRFSETSEASLSQDGSGDWEGSGYSETNDSQEDLGEEARPVAEDGDTGGPTDALLKTTFETMNSLDKLHLEGSTRLALIALSPLDSKKIFPRLCELTIDSTFDGIDDPFHSSLYENLNNYPRLSKIELFVRRSADSLVPAAPHSPSFPASPLRRHDYFHRLTSLSLGGPLSAITSLTLLLLSPSSPLNTLTLIDTTSGSVSSRIPNLLQSLPETVKLKGLSLSCTNRQDGDANSFTEALSRFSKLETLILGGPFPSPDSNFYETLARLPLKELVFLPRFPVSLVHLDKVVRGPSKSATLRSLKLNNIEVASNDSRLTRPVYMQWTQAFSMSGLRKFLNLVEMEEEDLVVNGSAIDAMNDYDYFFGIRFNGRFPWNVKGEQEHSGAENARASESVEAGENVDEGDVLGGFAQLDLGV